MKENQNPQGSPPHIPTPPLGVDVKPEITDLLIRILQFETDFYHLANKMEAQEPTTIVIESLRFAKHIEGCISEIGLLLTNDTTAQIRTMIPTPKNS